MVPRPRMLLAIGSVAALAASALLLTGTRSQPAGSEDRRAAATSLPEQQQGSLAPNLEPRTSAERTDAAAGVLVHVRVVDDDGRPVAGVTVATGSQPDSARADTDTAGIATLQASPGRHWISANYVAPRRRIDLYFAGRTVEIQDRAVDVELVLAKLNSTVTVIVTSDLGVPLPDALIEYVHSDRQEIETQTTNVHGVAVFGSLPPGRHTFDLLAKSIEDSPLLPPEPAMRSCDVPRRGTATLEYRLERKGKARLQLDGVAELEVPIRLDCKAGPHAPYVRVVNVKNTLAVLLPAGEYEAAPQIPAPMPAIARRPVRFQLAAGEDTLVRIPLESGPASLVLQIVDDHDVPVNDANVWIAPRDAGSGWRKELPFITNPSATYRFAGMPREPVRLHVDCKQMVFRDLAFDGQGPDRPWLDLDVAEGERRIVLHDAYSVCGRVLDRDGRAQEQGKVCCGAAGDDQVVVELKPDARFGGGSAFEIRHLAAGTHRLWIGDRADGPADAEVKVGPDAGPSRTVRVDLQRR